MLEATRPIILVQAPAQDRYIALRLMVPVVEDQAMEIADLLLREVMADRQYGLADLHEVHQADLPREVGPLQVDQVPIERINQV